MKFIKTLKSMKWGAWFLIMLGSMFLLFTQPFLYSDYLGLGVLIAGAVGGIRAIIIGFIKKLSK